MPEPAGLARRSAWLLCAVTVCGAAAQTALLVATGIPLLSPEAFARTFPIITLAVVFGAVVGAAIVDRHPRHRVGWLFCIGQAGASVGLAAQALAPAVLTGRVPVAPWVGQVAGWVGQLLGATYALTLLGLLLLLAPDGRMPSRRWWPVAATLVGGYALVAVTTIVLIPPRLFGPDGVRGAGPLATTSTIAGQLTITVGLAAAAGALVVRLRRASGVERQQLRWIGVAAGALVVALVVMVTDGLAAGDERPPRWYLGAMFYLGYLAVPVATGVAVLRYRLYDIDLIIGRTVRFAVLAVFVTAGYVTAVVAIGSVLAGSSTAVWPSLVAYVLVALAFQPLRRRVDRLADRIVHGAMAAPYDSLAELIRGLGASGLSERQLLGLVARCSALAVGAPSARATVFLPGGAHLCERWSSDADPAVDEGVDGEPARGEPARGEPHEGGRVDRAGAGRGGVPVVHQGEAIGRIELGLPAGHSLGREQRRLLDEVAGQAGLAFRNVRLTAALRWRAEALSRQGTELAASRRRLLTAADTERERVAAAIRTEVAVHLDPLPAALADLRPVVTRDPGRARRRLEGLQHATTVAIDALRTITAGVLPPLLARRGLAAAVQAYVARSPGRCTVEVTPGLTDRRLVPSVEAAAYHCCVRAIDAMAPDSRVGIAVIGDRLEVTVAGRRVGAMPDRQQVLDRLEAVGGQLEELESADGSSGWRAVLPLDPSAQAAASRSGPNTDFLM